MRTTWLQLYERSRPVLPGQFERWLTPVIRWLAQKKTNAQIGFERVRVHQHVTRWLGPRYRVSQDCIELDITYACNLHCSGCNRSCTQAPSRSRMTLEQVEAFVADTVKQRRKWRRIRVLGGEPTLHPHFFEILRLLRGHRDSYSPDTRIEVTTNGHGEYVKKRIEEIPADVWINNTEKETSDQSGFATFNSAPRDRADYEKVDYRNGCSILKDCGVGLTPQGYYPCAIAGGIDRLLGGERGRERLPVSNEKMEEELRFFCSLCGHFKRELPPEKADHLPSKSWQGIYGRRP